ncbi:hypothetical protein TMatcc_007413 [Talaromyces marneffei ATCC 18224]
MRSTGQLLAYSDDAGSIELWDVPRNYERNKLSITTHSVANQYSPKVTAMAFEPNNWRLWYVVYGGPVILWDISTISPLDRSISTGNLGIILNSGIPCNLAISPNNDLIVRVKDDIQFWSLPGFQDLRKLRNEGTSAIAISQTDFARVRHTLRGHTDDILSMDFSPDGGLLVTGSRDRTVRVWDIATEKDIAVMYGRSREVISVLYLPIGGKKLVVSGSADGTVRIWDYGVEKEIARIDNFYSGDWAIKRRMSFSQRNNLLAIASKFQGNISDGRVEV